MDTSVLKSYVGKYELAPSFVLTVSRENAKLFGQATGQNRFELFAESKIKFYLKDVDAQVSFISNEKGEVEQLILHQNGQNLPGKRSR